ncbi:MULTISPECIES: hypothetical protein [unclassified Streptomyces]|uniref:hypothetical protein n=1 Tax=unclassified Streptomyces TaxID=2593676 RepID=UPI0029666C3F|nr:hypothetical protein [Streptomyces sp. SJL17-1]
MSRSAVTGVATRGARDWDTGVGGLLREAEAACEIPVQELADTVTDRLLPP